MIDGTSRIWELARGFMPSRILLTAVELGVFGQLNEKPKPSAEVAQALGTDPRATDRLMNALVAIGILAKHDNLFGNLPDGEAMLVPGKPGYIGDALMHTVHLWDSWSTLTGAVRAGHSVFERAEGERPEWVISFIAAMHANASDLASEIVPLINLDGVHRVLDVGGGSGAYSIRFCQAKHDLNAVVFDLPDVVPLTQEYVEQAGLAGRVTTTAGDYNKDELGRDFDLVFLSQIIHSNDPGQNVELMRKCQRALRSGGRVIIQDFIVNEHRTQPPHAAIFALNMLVGTPAGDTFAQAEVEEWFAQAGMVEPGRIDPARGTTVLLSARKA